MSSIGHKSPLEGENSQIGRKNNKQTKPFDYFRRKDHILYIIIIFSFVSSTIILGVVSLKIFGKFGHLICRIPAYLKFTFSILTYYAIKISSQFKCYLYQRLYCKTYFILKTFCQDECKTGHKETFNKILNKWRNNCL